MRRPPARRFCTDKIDQLREGEGTSRWEFCAGWTICRQTERPSSARQEITNDLRCSLRGSGSILRSETSKIRRPHCREKGVGVSVPKEGDYAIKPSSVRRGKSKKKSTGIIANITKEKRFVHAIEASAAALGNAKEKERRSKELLIALFPWRRDLEGSFELKLPPQRK